MSEGKLISSLTETATVPEESSYIVQMGDGTGSKQVKHKNLKEQLKKELFEGQETLGVQEMTYEETLAVLNGENEESEEI